MAKSILIVDDSASVRQVVSISLRNAGYDVMEGSDGKDALSKLKGQKVHLIISDVNMPNMDGISFVKAVKPRETFLVFLPASTDPKTVTVEVDGRRYGPSFGTVQR